MAEVTGLTQDEAAAAAEAAKAAAAEDDDDDGKEKSTFRCVCACVPPCQSRQAVRSGAKCISVARGCMGAMVATHVSACSASHARARLKRT